MREIFLSLLILLCANIALYAQQDAFPENDPAIVQRIDEWRDLKFGFMMHWGPYSQWNIVESWSICPEDEEWCVQDRKGEDYYSYLQRYEKLPERFNPTRFDPEKWAEAAWNAGMRYMVFTTKHHDGFCMFDTEETEYKITGKDCAFAQNEKANIAKEIFNAFREKGFWTGAYFSKPDWHSEYYWSPIWTAADRNVNYDPQKYPNLWQKFCDFTYNQIEELMTGYGKMDILWLDGGWVRPEWSLDEETRPWIGCRGFIQDIDMPKIAKMARSRQPGLLVVDRTVHGKYENYQTPEQKVPDNVLDFPWETCMSMATSWSYVEKDQYKSTNQLIHLLIDIVAKGGNFLLNVGPSPEGTLHDEAFARMEEIGKWMNINGKSIYNSRPVAPYKSQNVCFTQLKEGNIFAIYLADEMETKMPEYIEIPDQFDRKIKSATLLGSNKKLSVVKVGENYRIAVPEALRNAPPCEHAWVFDLGKK
ncbi:MAG: alpha-L-fucosidase [Bacteroidales bacterium]|jgi:alpha-L-fucosidase|nr:alpha-L-fucosidase [Bacteroidales bacterium]